MGTSSFSARTPGKTPFQYTLKTYSEMRVVGTTITKRSWRSKTVRRMERAARGGAFCPCSRPSHQWHSLLLSPSQARGLEVQIQPRFYRGPVFRSQTCTVDCRDSPFPCPGLRSPSAQWGTWPEQEPASPPRGYPWPGAGRAEPHPGCFP